MLKILAPFVVVAVGLAGAVALVRSKVPVETARPKPETPLVEVIVVRIGEQPMMVSARGTVSPRTETVLAAQVAAEVVAVSPHFEVGGFFERGEILVRLDRRDYELATERAAARVAQAELRLVQQQAEARVAADEWHQLGDGEPDALVLREPQLAEARAALKASEAELGLARLDLERTLIRAPFDGRVRSKKADVGQYLIPGQEVAAIHSIDYAEVRLPVPDRQLAFLDLPLSYHSGAPESGAPEGGAPEGGAPEGGAPDGGSPDGGGPTVTLSANFTGRHHSWPGRVVRAEGELDPSSRMLHLVAQVEDPYGRRKSGRPPLAMGLFVDAEITGRTIGGALLPRAALHSGNRVVVVEQDNDDAGRPPGATSETAQLRWRDVDVVRIEQESVLIGGGLQAGERVCVSTLDIMVDGMEVRTLEVEALVTTEVLPEMSAEPLPAIDVAEAPPVTMAEDLATPRPSQARSLGRLLEVGLLEGGTDSATVAAQIGGQFSYSASRLDSPERFVVDLIGVVKAEPRTAFELAGGPVARVRIAQFQTEPEPITRIVFDLQAPGSHGASPTIERSDRGLTITF